MLSVLKTPFLWILSETMANFSDDYFNDIQITDADRVKAGYKIPKNGMIRPGGSIKPISAEDLRGDLSRTVIPVPINFHEGGMFSDAADRVSYSKPVKQDQDPRLLPDLSQIQPTVSEPHPQSTEPHPQSTDLTIPPQKGELIPLKSGEGVISKDSDGNDVIVRPQDEQTKGQEYIGPYRHDPMVHEGGLKEVNIGENHCIIARGPNNIYGRTGFYGGLLEPSRFGFYPGSSQAIAYNPINLDRVDANGNYVDTLTEVRQIQAGDSCPTLLIETAKTLAIEPLVVHDVPDVPDVPSSDVSKLTQKVTAVEQELTQLSNANIRELTLRVQTLEQTVSRLEEQLTTQAQTQPRCVIL